MQTRDKVGGEDGGEDVCTDEVDVDGGAVNCDVGVAPAAGVEVTEVLVSLKLKVLPWLASVWQRARHWDTKEGSITAAIFTCSSES